MGQDKPTKLSKLKGKPFKCAVVSTNRSKGNNAGHMSSYLCAVAKDDDRKSFVTCIKVRYACELQAERGGARSDFGPQPWTRWHTSCLMTLGSPHPPLHP